MKPIGYCTIYISLSGSLSHKNSPSISYLYPIKSHLYPIKITIKNYHQVTLLKSPVKFITITTVKRPSIRGRYATLQPLRSHLRVQAMLKDIYAWHHRAQNVDDGLLMDRAVPGSDTIKKKTGCKKHTMVDWKIDENGYFS